MIQTKKYKNIIVDGTNLFWRAFITSSKKFQNGEVEKKGIFTGSIVLTLDRINNLRKVYALDKSNIFFCFDNPNSAINIRRIISEGNYKHKRQKENVPKQLYKSLNVMTEILKIYSDEFRILWGENLEADDLTYMLLNYLNPDYNNYALFVSNDMDWSRNITDFSDWYNWFRIYDKLEFQKHFGFIPNQNNIKLYKALRGDKADNIDIPVPYLPKEILEDILNNCKDIDHLFKILFERGYPKSWALKIKDAERKIRINYQLVDFIPAKKNIEEIIYNCKRDERQSRIWFNSLGIELEQWMIKKENLVDSFFKIKKPPIC